MHCYNCDNYKLQYLEHNDDSAVCGKEIRSADVQLRPHQLQLLENCLHVILNYVSFRNQ